MNKYRIIARRLHKKYAFIIQYRYEVESTLLYANEETGLPEEISVGEDKYRDLDFPDYFGVQNRFENQNDAEDALRDWLQEDQIVKEFEI